MDEPAARRLPWRYAVQQRVPLDDVPCAGLVDGEAIGGEGELEPSAQGKIYIYAQMFISSMRFSQSMCGRHVRSVFKNVSRHFHGRKKKKSLMCILGSQSV